MVTRDELVTQIAKRHGYMKATAGLGDVMEHGSGQRRIPLTIIMTHGDQFNLAYTDFTHTLFQSPKLGAISGSRNWTEWHQGTYYIGDSGNAYTRSAIPAAVLEIADLFMDEMEVKLIIGA